MSHRSLVRSGALDDLLIVDFSRVLAGPYATMLLADLGAEVIKVERPGHGDDTRGWGPPFAEDSQSTYFVSVNRNKEGLLRDLGNAADLQDIRELALRADVVVENFKPGTLERFGLAYTDLSPVNPRLVMCSVTGFGSGAGRDLLGYDLLAQAAGGLMSVTGPVDGEPYKVGVAVVDIITGLHAVYGILAALHHRERTGRGQHVEVNLLSSLLSALTNQSAAFVAAGVIPEAMGNDHPSVVPYSVFATGDRRIVIAVGNDRQFRRLVEVLGLPALADNPSFATNEARVENRCELRTLLEAALAKRGADAWCLLLTEVGVPCGPINDIGQAFALAESLGLNPIVRIEGSDVPCVANPVKMSGTPPTYRTPARSLDSI
jgi:crotonobetainyl-CoA:carnitine CoA-transferase CaiB-like acyl-CoA transferase